MIIPDGFCGATANLLGFSLCEICEICVIRGLFQIFAFSRGKEKVTSPLRYRKKNSHGEHGGHGGFFEMG